MHISSVFEYRFDCNWWYQKVRLFLTFLFKNNSQPIYLLEKNAHRAILIISFLLILNDNKRVVDCDISVLMYTQVVKHWFHVVFWINELKTRKQVKREMVASFSSINIFLTFNHIQSSLLWSSYISQAFSIQLYHLTSNSIIRSRHVGVQSV